MPSTPEQDARFFTIGHHEVYDAIVSLNRQHRTTNNSQLSNATGISRTALRPYLLTLQSRGYIKDTGKGAAYHWRATGKQVPPRPEREPGPERLAKMFPLGGSR